MPIYCLGFLCCWLSLMARANPPTVGDVTAWVQPPDAWSLIQGHQEVLVRWQSDAGQCLAPAFHIRVTAGPHGRVVSQRVLEPQGPTVLWGGFTLTAPKVPVTVLPPYVEVEVCCDGACSQSESAVPVRTLLNEDTWLGFGAQPKPHSAKPSRFLGTNGLGGVWLYLEDQRRLRYLPVLGRDALIPVPGGAEPLGVLSIPPILLLVTPEGIYKALESVGTWAPQALSHRGEITQILSQLSPLERGIKKGGIGPCVVLDETRLYCWDTQEVSFLERGLLPDTHISLALDSQGVWMLDDRGLLRFAPLNRGGNTLNWQDRLRPSALPGLRFQSLPKHLGMSPDEQSLYLASEDGYVWKVKVEDEVLSPDTYHLLPELFQPVLALAVDGVGRVGAETQAGICTLQGQVVGCHGAEQGWSSDLRGMGWAVPGILWSGGRFILAGPSSKPVHHCYHGLALVGVFSLMLLLVGTNLYRFREHLLSSPDGYARRLFELIGDHMGYGIAVTLLFLPQALILAVDRILGDLDWPATPVSRVVPALLFLATFMLALMGARGRRGWRSLFSRAHLPALSFIAVTWSIYLLLWVWPGDIRPPEIEGTLTLIHFNAAVFTGVATLFFLFGHWVEVGRVAEK